MKSVRIRQATILRGCILYLPKKKHHRPLRLAKRQLALNSFAGQAVGQAGGEQGEEREGKIDALTQERPWWGAGSSLSVAAQ